MEERCETWSYRGLFLAMVISMMRFKPGRMPTLILLVTSLISGSGAANFAELEGFLNARSRAAFRASDQNILALLKKGTRGEILDNSLLPSGNSALRIRIMNGPLRGQKVWVYLNRRDPQVKIYETMPSSWRDREAQAGEARPGEARPTEARRGAPAPEPTAERIPERPRAGAETLKTTPAYRDTGAAKKGDRLAPAALKPANTEIAPAGRDGATEDLARAVVAKADRLGQVVQQAAAPPKTKEDCAACAGVQAPVQEKRVSIAFERRGHEMDRPCYNLVQRDGTYGSWGKKLSAIMREPKYMSAYTKANALGDFCPAFNQLQEEEKIKAWVWFWQSLAQVESSCNVNLYHGTTYTDRSGQERVLNPVEDWGLWAMELNAEDRSGRGSACREIKSFEGQSRCAVDIMFKAQLSQGSTASSAPESKKYWGPTRGERAERQVMPHMRRFRACF